MNEAFVSAGGRPSRKNREQTKRRKKKTIADKRAKKESKRSKESWRAHDVGSTGAPLLLLDIGKKLEKEDRKLSRVVARCVTFTSERIDWRTTKK